MAKRITSIQLHDVMFVPQLGEIKKTLSNQTHPGIELKYNKNETLIEIQFKNITFDIPSVNCKNVCWIGVGVDHGDE